VTSSARGCRADGRNAVAVAMSKGNMRGACKSYMNAQKMSAMK
jgi:hypothetical protein